MSHRSWHPDLLYLKRVELLLSQVLANLVDSACSIHFLTFLNFLHFLGHLVSVKLFLLLLGFDIRCGLFFVFFVFRLLSFIFVLGLGISFVFVFLTFLFILV